MARRWRVAFALALLACNGDLGRGGAGDGGATDAHDALPSFAGPTLGNNAATLFGAPFGTDPPPPDARRKTVSVVLGPGSSAGLTASSGTAVAALGETVFWMVPVRYDGVAPGVCGVRATGVVLTAPDTSGVTARDDVKLAGSLALANGRWASDCLAPGETGYLLGITIAPIGYALYTELATITLDLVAASSRQPLAARVVPKRYDVDASGLVSVTVANEGAEPVLLPADNFSRYVALGPTGMAVDWGFLADVVEPAGLLAPGATATIRRTMPLFVDGPSSALIVFVDVRSPDATSGADGGLDAGQR